MTDIIQKDSFTEATQVFIEKIKHFICLDRNEDANVLITLQVNTELIFNESIIVASEVDEKVQKDKIMQTFSIDEKMIIPDDDHDKDEVLKFERSLFPEKSEQFPTATEYSGEEHQQGRRSY